MYRIQEVTRKNGSVYYRIQKRRLFRWETVRPNIADERSAYRALEQIKGEKIKKVKTLA